MISKVSNILVSGESSLSMDRQLGAAHYSYRFVEMGYQAAISAAGFTPIRVDHPEFYSGPVSPLENLEDVTPIHISVRSSENMRICRPSYNIGMFAWEFDVLRQDEIYGDSPFDNQLRMLNAFDEIWTLCSFSRSALESYGLKKVRTVPAPVKGVATIERRAGGIGLAAYRRALRLQGSNLIGPDNPMNKAVGIVLGDAPEIKIAMKENLLVLSVLNPYDMRKNLYSIILGFISILEEFPQAALIIKLNVPSSNSDRQMLWSVIEQMPFPTSISNNNIFLLGGYVDDEELDDLYQAADFFISGSLAEGQNLPLQEAMLSGCIAVSPCHTAMLDYIRPDNSVIVQAERVEFIAPNTGANHARRPFKVDRPRPVDVMRTLRRAFRLTPQQRRQMRTAAVSTIEKNYSISAISKIIKDSFDEISVQNQKKTAGV